MKNVFTFPLNLRPRLEPTPPPNDPTHVCVFGFPASKMCLRALGSKELLDIPTQQVGAVGCNSCTLTCTLVCVLRMQALTCTDTTGRSRGHSRGRGRWRSVSRGTAHTAALWSGTRHWWLHATSQGVKNTGYSVGTGREGSLVLRGQRRSPPYRVAVRSPREPAMPGSGTKDLLNEASGQSGILMEHVAPGTGVDCPKPAAPQARQP